MRPHIANLKKVIRSGLTLSLASAGALQAEQRLPLADGWLFHHGELANGSTVSSLSFPKNEWQKVTIPHDWSIASTPDPEAATEGGGGFFETGTGWYRTTFEAPQAWQGQQVALYFEGVFQDTTVWINGQTVATHAYGYTPFRVDLTPHLKLGQENHILVRANNSVQPNTRFYSGSGIFRPVRLEVRDPAHVLPESLYARTRNVGPDQALVDVEAQISDSSLLQEGDEIVFRLLDGKTEAAVAHAAYQEKWKPQQVARGLLEVKHPKPWSPESPHLYTLTAQVLRGGKVVDETSQTIGLRTIRISSQNGFELNGKPYLLNGGNVHHDNGPLGGAAFAAAEWRKAKLLRDAGYNALRTAHNPPSSAFLEACDRLGILVFDESFDGWKSKKVAHDYGVIFDENWEQDLRAFIKRDRHHPSVVMWSIGNEVYERGNDDGIQRAHNMAAVIRQLDRSRPITIGLNGLGDTGDWTRLDGIFFALDAAGYNYELQQRHAEDHERLPNRVMYASESYQYEVFENWQAIHQHPYIIGEFVWSAIDYLGEAGIGRVFPPNEEARAHWEGTHFPWHGAYCGDIDLIGTRKPISYYRDVIWDTGTTLHAAVLPHPLEGGEWNQTLWSLPPAETSWNWPQYAGQEMKVEVYSRHPEVSLYLNGNLIGTAPTSEAEQFKATFAVPYQPGRLEARAGGETFVLETAGEPKQIALQAEMPQFHPDGHRLAFVNVALQDAEGRLNPTASLPVTYRVEGPAEIIGIGSGDVTDTASYQSNPRKTYQGRALVVVRATGEGKVKLTAEAPGISPQTLTLSF
ncbi:MAG: glycoside hydrolase family 2 TIM barrel-domain containing protein [Verrucomicrobiota bacterium JB022]|nr:glycoside hydrolase family 2 TIM barrel-domain containing protein [Verrucomicrobiota bacterium JB022]